MSWLIDSSRELLQALGVSCVFLWMAAAADAQTCAVEAKGAIPGIGQPNQHLILDPAIAPELQAEIPGAAQEWNTACANAPRIPSFSSSVGTVRKGNQTIHNSLLIIWQSGTFPELEDQGAKAIYDPKDQSITLAEKYVKDGKTRKVKWLKRNGELAKEGWLSLVHEFGHVLGLDHDTCTSSTAPKNSVMQAKPEPDGSHGIMTEHCDLADFILCDPYAPNSSCPKDPRVPCPEGQESNCPTLNPIDKLSSVCETFPRLCPTGSGGGAGNPGGDGGLWWTTSASQPNLECGTTWEVTCDDAGCTGTLVYSCKYVFRPSPEALSIVPAFSQGPTVAIATLNTTTLNLAGNGQVQVHGSAVDDGYGVREVAAWVDNYPIDSSTWSYGSYAPAACAGSSDPGCPFVGFSGMLNLADFSPGQHTLQVVAVNNRVLFPTPSYTEIQFTVAEPAGCGDTVRPNVAIASPNSGTTVGGLLPIAVTASDNVGVGLVQLHVDGALHSVDSAPPWDFLWDTTQVAAGNHTLLARAYDACGNNRFSATVAVTVLPSVASPNIVVGDGTGGPLVVVGSSVSLGTTTAGVAISRRFRIENTGTANLVLANPTTLVSGPCFHQIETPISPVPPGGTSYFRLRLLCATAQFHTGQVTIQSNDPAPGNYTFQVTGTVGTPALPDIAVFKDFNNAPVTVGVSFDLGQTTVGVAKGVRFRIENTGNADLILTNPAALVSGVCFGLSEIPAPSVPPGGVTHFRVRLFCYNAGSYTGTVALDTNDPDENPFTFPVTGTVTP